MSVLQKAIPADDTSRWGDIRDPEILRVKINGQNIYQVWQDYALIDKFKSRQAAKKLVRLLEKLNEGSVY